MEESERDARRVIKHLQQVDLKNRWNRFDENTGVRRCDMLSLMTLCNGYYASIEAREKVAMYWLSEMRRHYPNDILMVELSRHTTGHSEHSNDDVSY